MFFKKLFLICFSFLILSQPSFAQLKYVEGRDYATLKNPVEEVKNPKVMEIFWFGCSHCEALRKPVKDWVDNRKAKEVEFELLAAVTGASEYWDRPAQAFFTMQSLGLDLFDAYFDEIFKNRAKGLVASDKEVKKFFLKNGVNEEKFDKAWKSFEVKQKLQRARQIFKDTASDGVPLFIVNGKYIITPAGSEERQVKESFGVIEFLLKQQK